MKATMKKFDCVEMKRKGAAKIYEQIKDMTPEQELAWWKEREAATKQRIQAKPKHTASR